MPVRDHNICDCGGIVGGQGHGSECGVRRAECGLTMPNSELRTYFACVLS
jgi:hypothetical protein